MANQYVFKTGIKAPSIDIGDLSVASPEIIEAVEVVANVEYSATWTFPKTFRSTYIDYFYSSDEGTKMGTLFVLTDGTSTSLTDMGTEIDSPVIDFVATVVSTDIQIVGTMMTGSPTIEFKITMRHVL